MTGTPGNGTPLRKTHPALIDVSKIVPIVGDGGIAGADAEGRMVPLLILDTANRPDVDELIRIHSHISPGDVECNWASIAGHPDNIGLILDFIRPVQMRVVIVFSIEKQAILIDAALQAKALYLQTGRSGDKLSRDPGRPKIIVELPEGQFHDEWEPIFLNRMAEYISKRSKLSKRKAYPFARLLLEELRKLSALRMPPR